MARSVTVEQITVADYAAFRAICKGMPNDRAAARAVFSAGVAALGEPAATVTEDTVTVTETVAVEVVDSVEGVEALEVAKKTKTKKKKA